MLRKKLCKIIAALMVSTIVLGNNVQTVGATTVDATASSSIDNSGSESENQGSGFVNGTYEVDNFALRTGEEKDSGMKNYIERKSTIKVENDKITVTLKFNEAGLQAVKEVHGATVNGEAIETIKNEDGSVSFIVPSVDSRINIDLTYQAETPAGTWVHRTTFDLVNDTTSIPTVGDEENVETPDNSGGNTGNNGSSNGENTGGEEVNVLENGTYTINNFTYKVGTTEESRARNFIEDKTVITVKDGQITMTLKYKGMGPTYITSTNIKVNGTETVSTVNEDKSVSFIVPSIDANIQVEMNINVESMGFSEVQSIDFVHDINTLTKVEDSNSGSDETVETPDNNGGNTENEGSNNDNSNNDSSNNDSSNNETTEEQGTKVYTGKNNVTHDSETGLSMARKALEDTLKVEEINGNKYVTLTFTSMGSTMMNNHTVYVNGEKVDATKTTNGDIVSLRFAIGNLEDSIKVSAYVTMMGSNVEFGVDILEDTLTLITDETTNNGSTTEDTNSGNTTGTVTEETNESTATTEEETKVTKGKLYSIQNSVTHESETGREMARKYLNSTSKVEEIDGKYYVTLTFTGAEFMQNHEIYVNGKKVTVTKSTSGDTTNIRFAVSSLSDSIKVKTYVVPMSREVEFGVTLLEDTLTFIKEYTVETLPQTGAPIGAGAVAGLGMLLTSAGTVLVKKRK